MFIINLYRFIFGYVVLKIYGDFPERILNLCAKYHISIWNVHRRGKYIQISVMINSFKKFLNIRGKSGVRVKIIKKCGLPVYLSKYKLRFGVFAGFVLFFVVLKLLSGFVWNIEVVGAKNISNDEVIALCREQGIYVGQYIGNIDVHISKEKILLDSDKLAWAALNIEGSKITINITEVKAQVPSVEPSNIIATDDAVIKKIKIASGNCIVKTGEAVQKGDLLISGTVDVGEEIKFIRSSGEILGEVEQKIVINKNYIQQRKRYTGEIKRKYVLEFFNLKIPLFLGETKGDFVARYSKNQFEFLDSPMPIVLHSTEFKFYEIYTEKFTKSQLIEQIESDLEVEISRRGLKDVDIISREIYQDDTSVTVEYTIKYIKNICAEENLIFSTLN